MFNMHTLQCKKPGNFFDVLILWGNILTENILNIYLTLPQ